VVGGVAQTFPGEELALPPPSGLRNWLRERRPALAALLGEADSMPDTHALADLVATLYAP